MRVALLGAGFMGSLHAAKLGARADVRLSAVADPDLARARALTRKFGGRATADWRDAIRDADAAVIAAPTEHHAQLAAGALEAGLHVLVEKPFARTLEEADAALAAASRAKRVLQVGHVERCNPAFRALARDAGKPRYLQAERLAVFAARGRSIDVVLDLMVHDLDLVLALAGDGLARTQACGFRVLSRDIDIANAHIEFADGCVASLSASRVSQAPVRKLRVFEADVYRSADLRSGCVRTVRKAGDALEELAERHEGDALAEQDGAFVAAIHDGSPVPVDGAAGRRALAAALEVRRLVHERLERAA